MNKMRNATAPHQYKNQSATRKEKIVYYPTIRDNHVYSRFAVMEKFRQLVSEGQTGEMFLDAAFKKEELLILLSVIAKSAAKSQGFETAQTA